MNSLILIITLLFAPPNIPNEHRNDTIIMVPLTPLAPKQVYSENYKTGEGLIAKIKSRTVETIMYENIRIASEKNLITRKLYEIVVKQNQPYKISATETERSENRFDSFSGKTIKNISLSSTGLFTPDIDLPFYKTGAKFEQVINNLHVETRPFVIKNQLLFDVGETIDPFLISDNERLLRERSYLEDARIYIIEDSLNTDFVDVIVVTKDRWSRGFDGSLDDFDQGRVEFFNRNLLGMGQGLQTNILFDGNKEGALGFQAIASINDLGRSYTRSGISYLDAFGDNVLRLFSNRSFLTPTMKYAGGFDLTFAGLIDDFHFPDTSFYNQHLNFNNFDFWMGRSFLLNNDFSSTTHRRNIYITGRFIRSIFFDRPEIGSSIRYDYHNRNLYLASLSYTRLGYLRGRYIYGFGPTEDIPVGSKLSLTGGYENNQFFPRYYFDIGVDFGFFSEKAGYINPSVSIGSFFNNGIAEQGVLQFALSGFTNLFTLRNYYMRQFIAVNWTKGIRRFDDERISISNNYGIRGLKSDFLTGSEKLTVNTETVFFSKYKWFGFSYALFGIADFGWIKPVGDAVLPNSFFSGFGLGLKIKNEHLVLPALSFRIAYYPRMPEIANAKSFYIMSESRNVLNNFRITQPDLIQYR